MNMHINQRSRFLPLLLPVLLVVGFVARPHSAAALTIVPPSLEFSADPGNKIETKIKLFNEENDPISVFSSTANFAAKNEAGDPDFNFETAPTDLASWIDVGVGPYTLKPGDRLEIPVVITVPANAEPGGHYASVFFGTDPSIKPEGGGQVSVRSLIGSLIILRVSGDVRETASIASFKTVNGKASFSRLPITFALRIANQGNVHIRPKGSIEIKNIFGGETARLTINEVNGAVLPNSIRQFAVDWQKSGRDSQGGNFFEELAAEWRNFAFGPYTATVALTYGQSSLTLQQTLRVTVIPWELLLTILLVLGIIIFFLVWGIKRYNASIIRRAEEQQSGQTPPAKM